MKTVALLTAIGAAAFSSLADTSSLEKFYPHFFTNTPIIWQAPTNHLPKTLWTYKPGFPKSTSQVEVSELY